MDILIAFSNGEKRLINNVSDYGIVNDRDIFYFTKNSRRCFIPIRNVFYFGLVEGYRGYDYDEN